MTKVGTPGWRFWTAGRRPSGRQPADGTLIANRPSWLTVALFWLSVMRV
jgi:hypothetical protein